METLEQQNGITESHHVETPEEIKKRKRAELDAFLSKDVANKGTDLKDSATAREKAQREAEANEKVVSISLDDEDMMAKPTLTEAEARRLVGSIAGNNPEDVLANLERDEKRLRYEKRRDWDPNKK